MASSSHLRNSIVIASSFIAFLWCIKLFEFLSGVDLYHLGVLPRHHQGLIGIVTGPLIHGSWEHLLGNSLPTLILATLVIYGYPRSRWWAIAGIWLMSGTLVWLLARNSFHFGASGLTHGLFFYLFVGGILRRDRRSAALLMIAFYMYGGMILSIFPGDPGISFESHLFGALAGGLLAYLFRHWDKKTQGKRYSWQHSADQKPLVEEDDPIIGNQWKSD
jgi:membrane associated rhomboid family serine protease